jgi:hypothetical protein
MSFGKIIGEFVDPSKEPHKNGAMELNTDTEFSEIAPGKLLIIPGPILLKRIVIPAVIVPGPPCSAGSRLFKVELFNHPAVSVRL